VRTKGPLVNSPLFQDAKVEKKWSIKPI
jgi:hypothetical protein